MWSFRKKFDLRKASASRSTPPLDTEGNFITCSKYASIPLTEQDDPLPSHWGADRHAPIAEYFVCGFRDGTVAVIDVSGSDRMVRQLVHSHVEVQRDREQGPTRSEEVSEVVSLDICGTIAASIGSEDNSILVSFLYPSCGDRIVNIPSPNQQNGNNSKSGAPVGGGAFKSLLLWEGHPRWANQPDEERKLYLFVGTELGTVLLFQIDVVERTYTLHSVFAINVQGTAGIAAPGNNEELNGPGASRRYMSPIFSLALHDTCPDRTQYRGADLYDRQDEGGINLLAGTDKRWACWDLKHVPWLAGDRSTDGILIVARIYGQSSVSTSVPEDRLRGTVVFVPHTPEAAEKLFSRCPSLWRPKYSTVCCGAEVGTIMASTEHEWQVMFPSLRNTVTWPRALFDVINTQHLFGKGDAKGPIYCISPLGPVRMVTGGADGDVKVWEWRATDSVYVMLHSGTGRVTDLIKCLMPIRAPDVFLAGSYDGTLREWHIYDEPSVMLNRTSTRVIAAGEEGGARAAFEGMMGIATMSPVNGTRGVAISRLYELSIQTYAFMEVQGCEPPPDMVFDGEMTRPIPTVSPNADIDFEDIVKPFTGKPMLQ